MSSNAAEPARNPRDVEIRRGELQELPLMPESLSQRPISQPSSSHQPLRQQQRMIRLATALLTAASMCVFLALGGRAQARLIAPLQTTGGGACGSLTVADPNGTEGSASDPCLITSDADLDTALAQINTDTAHTGAATLDYKLTADLNYAQDASNTGGASTANWSGIDYFSGTFDGDGHTISNITYTTDSSTEAIPGTDASGSDDGFFKVLDGATVENLTLANATVATSVGNASAGGVAVAAFNSTIAGVSLDNAAISATGGGGNSYVGGLVGVADANGYADDGSTTSDGGVSTFTDDSVTGSIADANRTGGIVGVANGPTTVSDDYVDATLSNPVHAVSAGGYYYVVGGLVGMVGNSYTTPSGGTAAGVSMTGNVIEGTINGEASGTNSNGSDINYSSATVGYATTGTYSGSGETPTASNWSTSNDLTDVSYTNVTGAGVTGADGTTVSAATLQTEATYTGSQTGLTDASTGSTYDQLDWNFGSGGAVRPWTWNNTGSTPFPELEPSGGVLGPCGSLTVADPNGTEGSASDPCLITSDADLDTAMEQINADTAHTGAATLAYKLTADLNYAQDASNTTGASTANWSGIDYFSGTFDGDGHTISNITYTADSSTEAIPGTDASGSDFGFFKVLDGATVENLTLTNANVAGNTSNASAGGVAVGAFASTITGVSLDNASIVMAPGGGDSYVGGLVGVADANSYADDGSTTSDGGVSTFTDDSVTGSVADYNRTGGIVGVANGPTTVTDDYVNATLSNPGHPVDGTGGQAGTFYYVIGGLVGMVGTSYTTPSGGTAAGVSMTDNVVQGTIEGEASGQRSHSNGTNYASATVGWATTSSYSGSGDAPTASNWSTSNDLVGPITYTNDTGSGLPGADGTPVSPTTLQTEATYTGSQTGLTDASTGSSYDQLDWNFGSTSAVRPWTWNNTGSTPFPELAPSGGLTVQNTTILVANGSDPTDATLLSDAGATATNGTATIDTSGVNFSVDGSYQATISVSGAFAAPITVRIIVYTPGQVIVTNPTVAFATGTAAPSEATVLSDLGAMLPPGASGPLTVDLTGAVAGDQAVNWDQAGSYTVTVSDTDSSDDLQSVTATIVITNVPTINVTNSTVYFNVASPPTGAQVLAASGATLQDSNGNTVVGTLTATLSTSPIVAAGSYTATISATDSAGDPIAPVTVNVVVTNTSIALTDSTPVFQVSSTAPTTAEVIDQLGATISNGSGSPTVDLDGATAGDQAVNFDKPGQYRVTVSDTAADDAALPVTATIEVVPVSVITLANPTVYFNVASPPTPSQVITAAGAKITDGSGNTVSGKLSASVPSGCGASAGSCTATLTGTDTYGFTLAPVTVTVDVSAAAVSVTNGTAFFTASGSAPSQAALIAAFGASVTGSTTGGGPAVDASAVDWSAPGTYTVTVSDNSAEDAAATVSAKVQLVPVPVVSLPATTVYLPASSADPLDASTLLANSGASLTDGQGNTVDGTLSADTSQVNGSVAGSYTATITGTDDYGFKSAPVTVTVVIYLSSQQPGSVSISGTPAVGATLTADLSGWENLASPTYQWLRDGSPISGATGQGYTVAAADLGQSLSVQVTEAPQYYESATATSAAVVVPSTVPDAPTGVSATAGAGEVTVSWSAPDDGGSAITGYEVFDASSKGGESLSGTPACTATDTSCTVSGLVNGSAEYFEVVAVNQNGASAASTEVSATPSTVPAAPSGVTVTVGDGLADVTWSAPDDGGSPITGYAVYTATSPGGENTSGSAACTATNTGGCVVTGLSDGTMYYFVVVATNANGSSPASAEVSAEPVARVGIPTDVTATASNKTIKVSWSAPSTGTVAGYAVYVSTKLPVSTDGQPACTTTTATSCQLTGLHDGTLYYLVVVATGIDGSTATSATVGATPKGKPTTKRSTKAVKTTPATDKLKPGTTGTTITEMAKTLKVGTAVTVKVDEPARHRLVSRTVKVKVKANHSYSYSTGKLPVGTTTIRFYAQEGKRLRLIRTEHVVVSKKD